MRELRSAFHFGSASNNFEQDKHQKKNRYAVSSETATVIIDGVCLEWKSFARNTRTLFQLPTTTMKIWTSKKVSWNSTPVRRDELLTKQTRGLYCWWWWSFTLLINESIFHSIHLQCPPKSHCPSNGVSTRKSTDRCTGAEIHSNRQLSKWSFAVKLKFSSSWGILKKNVSWRRTSSSTRSAIIMRHIPSSWYRHVFVQSPLQSSCLGSWLGQMNL